MPLFAAKPAASAPRFAEPLKNVTADEGSPLTLECRIAGHPDPIVRWYKEGRPIIAGPGIEIQKQGDRASLTLYGATEQDSGQYTCIAQNPSGENATSAAVIVSGKYSQISFCDGDYNEFLRRLNDEAMKNLTMSVLSEFAANKTATRQVYDGLKSD